MCIKNQLPYYIIPIYKIYYDDIILFNKKNYNWQYIFESLFSKQHTVHVKY